MSYDEAQTHLGRLTALCGTNTYGAKAVQFFNLQTERITELEKELAEAKDGLAVLMDSKPATVEDLRSKLSALDAAFRDVLNERDAAKAEAVRLREALEGVTNAYSVLPYCRDDKPDGLTCLPTSAWKEFNYGPIQRAFEALSAPTEEPK